MARLIEFLAHLDLIEPLDALIRSIFVGSSWRFTVPRNHGWTGQQIEDLLQRHGVTIWGRNFDREHLFFRVKARQANWAEYLLWRHGIPVLSRPYNPRNEVVNQDGPRPFDPSEQPAPAQHTSWLDDFLSFFF